MELTEQVELNQKKQEEIIEKIIGMLPDKPRSYDTADDPGFWTDGSEILCPSVVDCEVVATFLKDVLSEFGTMDVHTGYYDPYEDSENEEQDNHTGFYYISFE